MQSDIVESFVAVSWIMLLTGKLHKISTSYTNLYLGIMRKRRKDTREPPLPYNSTGYLTHLDAIVLCRFMQ